MHAQNSEKYTSKENYMKIHLFIHERGRHLIKAPMVYSPFCSAFFHVIHIYSVNMKGCQQHIIIPILAILQIHTDTLSVLVCLVCIKTCRLMCIPSPCKTILLSIWWSLWLQCTTYHVPNNFGEKMLFSMNSHHFGIWVATLILCHQRLDWVYILYGLQQNIKAVRT